MLTCKLNWIIVAIAFFLIQTMSANAQKKSAQKALINNSKKTNGSAAIPSDTSVKIGKLSNGLTYYIRKNVTPEKRAVLYLAVKAGSLMETDAQSGLAHFTEHMAFNGTKDFPKHELIDYLQKAGVRFGSDLNAYTSFEETVYQLPIPTDSAGLFQNGFTILANWAAYINMDDQEIDAERGIIEEEERVRGKNMQSRMQDEIFPVVLHGARHAFRLPIGKMDVIKNFDHTEIRKFYKDWYRPDLMGVIAVGDFDPAEVESLIKKNFDSLRNPPDSLVPEKYSMPANDKPVVKKVTDPEQAFNMVTATIRSPGRTTTTVEQSTLEIYQGAAIALLNRRLGELQLKGKLPVLQASISYGGYLGGIVKNVNALEVSAVTAKPEELTMGLAVVMDELERAVRFGFTQDELEEIKKIFLMDNEKTYAERDKVPSQSFVNQYLSNFLLGTPLPSVEYSYGDINSVMAGITTNHLNAVIKELRHIKNLIIVVKAPESNKDKLPSDEALIASIHYKEKALTPYVREKIDKPLLQTKPVAGKVIKKEVFEKIAVTKWELINGIQVYFKPTTFKNDEIIFRSYSPGGFSISEEKDLRAIAYSAKIPGNGLADFDIMQLTRLLQGSTVRSSAYIDNLYQGFSGSVSPKDLEKALQMVYLGATHPRKDTTQFGKHIEDMKVMLTASTVSPESVFRDTLNSLLTAYHPRTKKMTVEQLSEMSLDRSLDFYKQRFADNSGQTFVFVGNFVPDSIQTLIETYIGSLPVTGKKENYVDVGMRPLPGRIERTVKMGIEDKATVNLYFHDKYKYSPETNVHLVALTEILNYKMTERLREKEGGVYSPSVSMTNSKLFEQNYSIVISFGCSKGNVDRLVDAVLDEIEKLKKSGPSQTDIDKFKAERMRMYELAEKDNGFWLNYMINMLQLNEDLNTITVRKGWLNWLTPESVREAANKYLTGKNLIKAVLIPADLSATH